jgi:hypothetical protein
MWRLGLSTKANAELCQITYFIEKCIHKIGESKFCPRGKTGLNHIVQFVIHERSTKLFPSYYPAIKRFFMTAMLLLNNGQEVSQENHLKAVTGKVSQKSVYDVFS